MRMALGVAKLDANEVKIRESETGVLGLYDPATKTVSSLGKTIRDGMLVNNKVECSSCHDIHKTKGYSASSVQMLLVNNSGSALCFTCHNK